jgi:hypothetical protein
MKAFWLGIGVGIGLGILAAPKGGEDTRNELWERMRDWKGSVHNASRSQDDGVQARGRESERDASPEGEVQGASATREASHDKTLADSFPTSEPPSTIPDPSGDESAVAS